MPVNAVLALTGLELDPYLGGDLAELGEAETRAADRTVVPVPDLPEQTPPGCGSCFRYLGATGRGEPGAIDGRTPRQIQVEPACRIHSRAARPGTLIGIVPLVRKERVQTSGERFVVNSAGHFFRGIQEI